MISLVNDKAEIAESASERSYEETRKTHSQSEEESMVENGVGTMVIAGDRSRFLFNKMQCGYHVNTSPKKNPIFAFKCRFQRENYEFRC